MASNESTFWNDSMEMEPELTDREKLLRDIFVTEYIKDYNPEAAAIRCGFMKAFAVEYAKKFMQEAYVLKRIKAVELHQIEDEGAKDSGERDRLLVMASLRQIAYNPATPAAARVQALAKLAEIRGMTGKAGHQGGKGGPAGGVIMVPAIADIDDWEKVAMESQDKLIADARA